MSQNQIETLQKHSREILLSEIGALIHDIGKLNKFFVEKKSLENISDEYHHGNVLEYDSNEGNFYAPNNSLKQKAKRLKSILKDIKVSYTIEKSPGNQSDLYSFLKYHHNNPNNNFTKLLNFSDGFDAGEDRGEAFDKQSIRVTYQSNAFGYEKELDLSLYEIERSKVYDLIIILLSDFDIDNIKKKREDFLENLKGSLNKALGMTARAANDVTLWEHSYMTASIMKTLFAENILSKKPFPIVKSKEEIKKEDYFKILSIGWGYFDFMAQSQKITDILGREKALDNVKSLIKKEIELEYLLGNCIYEDNSSIHFLIPVSFENKDLIKKKIYRIFNDNLDGMVVPYVMFSEKGKSLVKLLPKAIQNLKKEIQTKKIPSSFNSKWIQTWAKSGYRRRKLICSNCGKGFYFDENSEEICQTCVKLRKVGGSETFPQTQFIDEIAWNKSSYGNVALFVLHFDLKNWLNGTYIESLFMRKNFSRFSTKFLYDYYKNEDEIKNKHQFRKIFGPLQNGWILNKNEKAKLNSENILNSIKLNDFCATVFNDSIQIKEKILETLKNDPENFEYLEILLAKLKDISENESKKVEKKKEKTENNLLNPEKKNKEIKLFKNEKTLNEIINNLFLKNPSPSRLMRVWNSTEEFFKSLEKEICQNVPSVKRYVLDGIEKNDPTGKAWKIELSVNKKTEIIGEVVFEDGKCVTITPDLNSFIEEHNHEKFDVKLIDKETKEYDIFPGVDSKKIKFSKAYRIITVSPDQFMFLAPASSSLKILGSITKSYNHFFGKVFGKLPLNIGVVYFPRKTPIFSVLNSAKRFNRNFEEENRLFSDESEIPSFKVKEITANKIIFSEGYKVEKRSKLGNCEIDYYHPHLLVDAKDAEDVIEIMTDNGIITQKHINSIKKGDKIRVRPSFFDFEFLDTNIRRFDIILNERTRYWKKRKHPIIGADGPRPYLLGDLDKFERLKQLFKKIGSWTPIRDLETLTIDKRQEWKIRDMKDSVYEDLVDSALENKISIFFKDKKRWKDDKSFLLKCILEGSFFDAIELYKSIMKIDLRVKK